MRTKIKNDIKTFLMNSKTFQKKRYLRHSSLEEKQKLIYHKKNKVIQLTDMIKEINIKIDSEKLFQHWIDEKTIFVNCNLIIGNMPPNYKKIIEHSLNDLINNEVDDNVIDLLNGIKLYIDRIIIELQNTQNKNSNIEGAIQTFKNMLYKKAVTLEEALQRILFWSSLFWQSGHKLVGLGRLDVLLKEYENQYDSNKTVQLLEDFLSCLHDYYEFKSAQLLGDTGQNIIIGGVDEDGAYNCNKISYYLIEAIKKCNYSDPKLLLRISSKTPDSLIEAAVKCIATGVGSPLLSNDDVIIPTLIDFGYEIEDAYNYVTSACWEPLSYGNSLEQNNLSNINFANVFSNTIQSGDILNCESFEAVLRLYKKMLKNEIDSSLRKISSIIWEEDPLYSFFTDFCYQNHKDISKGGSKYNNYGILSVGMSNVVNSLLNVKKYVFEEKEITLKRLNIIWKKNQVNDLKKIDLNKSYFGHDDEAVINLTNSIIDFVVENLKNYRNKYGGKVKFGLSSPGYISSAKLTGITFDSRLNEPVLGVHISANDDTAYTELVSFASQLSYTGLSSNGNVIDFFVAPKFIEDNFEKFLIFVRSSIKQGFFQMQMNVVSSSTLIEARKNPENFPNLIVRVWGFSAYFNDLPDDYKEVLITRAKLSEGFSRT